MWATLYLMAVLMQSNAIPPCGCVHLDDGASGSYAETAAYVAPLSPLFWQAEAVKRWKATIKGLPERRHQRRRKH